VRGIGYSLRAVCASLGRLDNNAFDIGIILLQALRRAAEGTTGACEINNIGKRTIALLPDFLGSGKSMGVIVFSVMELIAKICAVFLGIFESGFCV